MLTRIDTTGLSEPLNYKKYVAWCRSQGYNPFTDEDLKAYGLCNLTLVALPKGLDLMFMLTFGGTIAEEWKDEVPVS